MIIFRFSLFPVTKQDLDFFIAKKCIEDLPSLKDLVYLKESYFNKIDLKFISSLIKDSLTENLKEVLYSIILLSKVTDLVDLAASNAITFLNKSGFVFTDRDFSGIRIPSADLSYGMFINTNFESCNLSRVDFSKSHIYNSNFKNCNMTNTNFGEQAPAIQLGEAIDNLAFSSCGRFFATTNFEKVFLYSSETYQEIAFLSGHMDYVIHLLFSDNGNYLASSSSDSSIFLWDTYTKHELARFSSKNFPSFSPCSTYLCIMQSNLNGKIFIYNIKSSKIEQEICNSIDIPQFSFFSCSSQNLITLFKNGTLLKWDLSKNQIKNSIQTSSKYASLISVSLCRRYLAIPQMNVAICVYNVKKFELIQKFHIKPFNYFVLSNFGKYLAVKLRNNNIDVYDREIQSQVFEIFNANDIIALTFSPSNHLAFGMTDGTLKSRKIGLDLNWNKKIATKYRIRSASFSLDSKYFAAGTEKGWIFIYFLENQKLFKDFDAHNREISCISWSISVMASSSYDNTIKVWDIYTNILFKVFKMECSPSNWIQFSPSGKEILSCDSSGAVAIIDIDKSELKKQSKLNKQHVSMCCWFCNGEFVITSSAQKSIYIWNAKSQELVTAFAKQNQDEDLISVSPCGKFLASTNLDKNIKIWLLGDRNYNFQGNRVVKEFYVKNIIRCITWSSDGKRIIAGDEEGQMLVIDKEKLIDSERAHKECVTALDASRRGNFIVFGSKNKLVIYKLEKY